MPEQTGAMNFLLSRCSHAALSELHCLQHLRVSVVNNVYLVVLVMTALSATSCNLNSLVCLKLTYWLLHSRRQPQPVSHLQLG